MPPPCPRIHAKFPRWLLIVAAIVASVALLVLIILPAVRKIDYGNSYVVMVDAGSSSSKIYVYSWESGASSKNTPAHINQEFFQRSRKRGISSYTDSPATPMKEIVTILKEKVLEDTADSSVIIPTDQLAMTPIYMAATAGMRLLEARDPVACRNVLNSVRTQLSSLGFLVRNSTRQMRIISGDEEALAGWISTNYLSQTLQRTPDSYKRPQEGTIGALDMGGASTQISFATKDSVGEEVTEVSLYGHQFKVYQHSFLCFGKYSALLQLYYHLWKNAGFPIKSMSLKNPCAQTGYSITVKGYKFLQKPCFTNPENKPLPEKSVEFKIEGSGDPQQCRKLIQLLFQRKKCQHKRCSFEGIYQPKLPPGKFVAFSSYYFAMRFFNVTMTHASRPVFRDIIKKFCQRPWDSVHQQFSSMVPTIFLSGYCFDGIYIDEVLSHLGFTDERWSDISFVGKIGNRKMSWPLGFILKESARVPTGIRSDSIPEPTYVGLIVLFVLVLILAVALLLIFVLSRWFGHRYTQASTEQPQNC